MSSAKFRFVDCAGQTLGHQFAAAQYADAAARRQHLVKLVRNENDRQSGGHEFFQRGEQRVRFLRRQHRRGLVENEDFGAAVKRLENFDTLAFANRQRGDRRIRIDRQPESLPQFANAGCRLAAVRRQGEQRFGSQHDVVEDTEIVGKGEMLVHHADACGNGCPRLARRERFPLDFDRPLIGDIVAEQDVHQRGLTGAVLTQEADDFAARQCEGDRVVGDQRAEALANAGEPENGLRPASDLRGHPLMRTLARCRRWQPRRRPT